MTVWQSAMFIVHEKIDTYSAASLKIRIRQLFFQIKQFYYYIKWWVKNTYLDFLICGLINHSSRVKSNDRPKMHFFVFYTCEYTYSAAL